MDINSNTNENTTENNNDTLTAKVSVNIALQVTRERFNLFLAVLDIDAPLPPIEEVNQFNLQITIDDEE